ncbi:Ionotropic receptor 110 [Diabrotica virgifera virgifera]|nr:Ionotropic receptor 110 [Diabrotica virgifera virgifera]
MWVATVIFEILLFCYADSKLDIDYSESLTNQSSLNKCLAVHLSAKFYKSIIFIYENAFRFFELRQSMWKELLDHQKHTYMIISSKKDILFSKNQLKSFKSVVVEFTVLKELRKTILNIKRFLFVDERTSVFVFSTEAVKHPKKIADKVFQLLLEEWIKYTIVLLVDEEQLSSFRIYSYSFFFDSLLLKYSCENGKTSNRAIVLYDGVSAAIKERYTIQTRFQPIPPFIITDNNTVNPDNPGMEMLLMNTLAEQLNLKINHTSISHSSVISTNKLVNIGNVYPNGTATREFKELSDKKIDIIFGSFFQTYERMLYFSSSNSFFQHQLVWCVPRKVDQQSFPKIQIEVLVLFLLCFLILILLIWLVNRREKHSRKYQNFLHYIIYSSVSIFFAVSITKQPKTAFLRYLIALLIIFSLLCNNIFTSSITSFLISKKSKLKYDTMKKIYDHNLTTYFTLNKFDDIDGVPKALIEQRRIMCRDYVSCFKHVAQGDSAFLTLKIFTQYFAPRIDLSAIYCFDFLNSIPIGLVTRKEFLFSEKFNKKIQEIVSAGLIQKWTRDLTTATNWTLACKERRLSIGEFKYLFQMTLCGYLLSFLVFLYEVGLFSKLLKYILRSNSKRSLF